MTRIVSCDRSYLSKEEGIALDGISKNPLLKSHIQSAIGKHVSKAIVKKQLHRYIIAENRIIKECGKKYLNLINKEILDAGEMEGICLDLLSNIAKKSFITDHNEARLHAALGNGKISSMIRIINDDLIHREDTALREINSAPIYINNGKSEWNNVSIESLLSTSFKTGCSLLTHNVTHNDSCISIKIPTHELISLYQSISSADNLDIRFNYNTSSTSVDSRDELIKKQADLLEEAILEISKAGVIKCKSKYRTISPNTIWRSYDISVSGLFL